ncbi:MAG: hypothetical protein HRT88_07395 [Lentisphaeraceae bacterium]|nr:hypothetical protein [Lentisphaeraceae bacterium]
MPGGIKTVISRTVTGALLFPAERFPDKKIPLSLDAVVRKAMAHQKDNRYSSVEELKKEVNNYLTGYSTMAENAGFFKEFNLFFNRNKQVSLVVLGALLLIVGASSLFMMKIQAGKEKVEKTLSELQQSHEDLKMSREKEKQSHLKSEMNHKKFLKQREQQRHVSKQLFEKNVERAYQLMNYPEFFVDPVESSEKALQVLDGESAAYIAKRKIVYCFISQRFLQILLMESQQDNVLALLAKKYANTQRNEHGGLDDKDFVHLLRALNNLPEKYHARRISIMERMIFYQMALKREFYTSFDVVVELLKAWNPQWDRSKISYNSKNLHLKISGENFVRLRGQAKHSSSQCFLELLRLNSLELKNTGINSFHEIHGLSLKLVDIRNSEIKSIQPHSAMKSILRVVIKKGQFSKSVFKKAPKTLKIIEQ